MDASIFKCIKQKILGIDVLTTKYPGSPGLTVLSFVFCFPWIGYLSQNTPTDLNSNAAQPYRYPPAANLDTYIDAYIDANFDPNSYTDFHSHIYSDRYFDQYSVTDPYTKNRNCRTTRYYRKYPCGSNL